MKYRWGFLDENDAFSECFPKVDDGTAIDFAPESGEVFYRAKLNGNLSFRYEFDAILAEGYNYEHKIVLQWYDADNDEWKEVWKGRFALTDCEIDFDTKTITVTPSTLDRYTQILDHREDEYNLVKLAAQQQPVGIQIRPLMQFYSLNDSKLVNLIGGNTWEASCDTTGASTIETDYHFRMIKENLAFWLKFDNTVPNGDLINNTILMSGTPDYSGSPREFDMTGQYWNGSSYLTLTLRCRIVLYDDETHFALYWPSGGGWEVNPFVVAVFERDEAGTAPAITIHSYLDDANAQWDKVYFRMLLNAEGDTYHGQPLFDLPANDMAGTNLNYNKISQIAPVGITFYQNTQTTPTEWGLSYNNEYFLKPSGQYFPIGQGLWKYVSVWGLTLVPYTVFDDAIKLVQIRDCYKLPSVITRLFQKAGLTPQYFISRVLNGGNDYVGEPFYLCITPRSNVISSYYDTPAQNAPITLAKILSMLKEAYQIYWHIDENGNIHFEHISYYDNGYKYTEDAPGLLVDLETELHTNTKNNKVYGQNKVKFDKQDMPQQIKFLWEDKQTPPFDGYAIKMLDKYVNQGNTEEKAIGGFDSDVDFVLASPNDVSKDGMFLFACPASGGVISWNLDIQDFTIKDETGFEYEVSIQNADAAFWKIHDSFWRYSLPCENVNINNEDTTAITTGRFKVQSVEFADSVMADILKNIDNCNKVLRTQQGDGHIKSISINLNSLVAKGDLLFNFVGRWYYLKGLALGNSFTAIINGESITIDVSANKYSYRYKEPIATLKFAAADVVSVEFGDCDNLDNLTSCDEMFDGCEELLAVDFGNKTFGAVTSANNMFRGCIALTTLICPDSSKWKADLDLSDCPSLTTESFYDLIKFLYYYESGVHTITPNSTMWNALDGDTQTDLIAKATERGWTINMPAAYSITGQSAGNTVYATINGTPVEIPVSTGSWHYDYNGAVTSFSFANDADVTDIDFSLSDGLAGVTSLNDAFKNCAGLTTVDFTNCDLSNVASASDAFANCSALYELIIPADSWQPDIDLSASVMPKTEMLNVINGLYVYTSGTHTISFNQIIWDAMSVADQQQVYNAADAKGWTTNAVAVTYVIRGTSSNVNGTETFNIRYTDNGVVQPQTTVTVPVDSEGNWSFMYKLRVYSLKNFAYNKTTILSVDFSDADDFGQCVDADWAFDSCTNLVSVNLSNATFINLIEAGDMFDNCAALTTIIWSDQLDLSNLQRQNLIETFAGQDGMFARCPNLTELDFSGQTFGALLTTLNMFKGCTSLATLNLSNATFASATNASEMFQNCAALTSIDLHSATFAAVTSTYQMFINCGAVNIDLSAATFANLEDGTGMFQLCAALEGVTFGANLNLDKLKYLSTSNNYYGFFEGCTHLKTFAMPTQTFPLLERCYRMFYNCAALTSIDLSAAVMSNVTIWHQMYYNCKVLTDISVPQNSTAPATSSTANNGAVNLAQSPLNYTSMLKIANWLRDFTGGTAHTCTFNTTAWNALTAAEQATIDGILSGKNWNRAIA